VILVETVGVGQSEIAVRSMVDFFLLMMLPGGGDELQGIKKGVVELADALFVNKADGENRGLAELSRREYATALRYITPATRGWRTESFSGSALTGEGLPELWALIERFYEDMGPQGFIQQRRREQTLDWLKDLIRDELNTRFFGDARVILRMPQIEDALIRGEITANTAAKELFQMLDSKI
jgi:LAO/AO transport system kinase